MNRILATAILPNIAPASLAEFKDLAATILERVRTEPGTLQHDWFLNSDETRCVVHEGYVDSEAVLAHLGNVGEFLGKLIELGGGVELEVFGDPSPDLVAAPAGLQPRISGTLQTK